MNTCLYGEGTVHILIETNQLNMYINTYVHTFISFNKKKKGRGNISQIQKIFALFMEKVL